MEQEDFDDNLKIAMSKGSSGPCVDILVTFTCNKKGLCSDLGLTKVYRQTFTALSEFPQKNASPLPYKSIN
jgi:hypothetical protein